MNLKFWDRKARLIAALAKLTDDEAEKMGRIRRVK